MIIVSYTGALLYLGTVVSVLILGAKATSLTQLEQKLNDLEKRICATEQQLEYGEKHFQNLTLSRCCYK